MDYKDYAAGASDQGFWFQGKLGLIKKLFDVYVPINTSKEKVRILNVGVGTGSDIKLVGDYGNVYAVDISKEALALVPDELVAQKSCADICDLPYDNDFFDIVVAFDVLEHIKDDARAAEQIHRVLKPGGLFISTVPAFNTLFSAHDVQLHHFRRYNKKSYGDLLKSFSQRTMGYWLFSGFVPAAALRLCTRKQTSNKKGPGAWLSSLNSHIISRKNIVSRCFNSFCYSFLSCENWLISKGVKFPFGLTLYGVHQKTKGQS